MSNNDKNISIQEITNSIVTNFSGLSIVQSWGETNFFYNPEGLLKRGMYFCTIKEKDGPNDKASNLNRKYVFRCNFGLSKQTFLSLFSSIPKRPAKGQAIEGAYDFTKHNALLPHPIYGWMAWVAILNPSQQSWQHVMTLLDESYALILKKYRKKVLKG